MEDVRQAKAKLRRIMRKRREDEGALAGDSARIVERLLETPEYARARVIAAYMPLPGEVDIRPLFERARRAGRSILLPRVERSGSSLVFYPFTDSSALIQGKLGIWEPDPSRVEPAEPSSIDLVIVPGLAFDRRGYRLGYGGGYYDRTLSLLVRSVRMAVAFSWQVLDFIPHDAHDERVSVIVTPDARIDV
ncbi:MAG: 5-formyltetrahydrofolate cyclo-ligase [Hydrogenibacillus sp.]|nr:5-formyltetrahydrofolate cyclo-ligase [Hydrogenibacillus sp.]